MYQGYILADAQDVIVVDARIRVMRKAPRSDNRLAIRPYPKELEGCHQLAGIGRVQLRPIRPEDASKLAQLIEDLAPEDRRMRFFTPLQTLGTAALVRLTQIDYDREMAFVAYVEEVPNRLLGVARLAADPDNIAAEFAIVVRSEFHRRGLGKLMLGQLVAYAQARGTSELFGDVLAENHGMLALCAKLGFSVDVPESQGVVRVRLRPPIRSPAS